MADFIKQSEFRKRSINFPRAGFFARGSLANHLFRLDKSIEFSFRQIA